MIKLIALAVLLFLAVIPVFIMLIYIYFTDKVEREPIWLVLLLLFLGGLSTISALILETVGGLILSLIFEDGLGSLFPSINFSLIMSFFECFFVVAVAEELGKFVMMAIPTWKNKHFNYRFDGMVYAVTSSLGFALVENLLYILPTPTAAIVQGGFGTMLQEDVWAAIGDGFGTGILRALTSIPGHTMFGVFMGLFYGFAKYYSVKKAKGKSFLFIILSLLIPIFIHGLYDFLLSAAVDIADSDSTLLIFVALFVMVAFLAFIIVMYIAAFIITRIAAKKDKPLFIPLVTEPFVARDLQATYSSQAQPANNNQEQPVYGTYVQPSNGQNGGEFNE